MRIKSRGAKGKEAVSGAATGQQPAIRLRAVVRHLPSLLKESEFRDVMSNYINDETTDHLTWVQGKIPEEFVAPVLSVSSKCRCS
jgi:regulator of nonsense transcripts 3